MSQYYIAYDMNNQPYFAHSGVKGMKWGSFHWWTPDKKLTPAGREHYGIGDPRTKSSDGGAKKHKGFSEQELAGLFTKRTSQESKPVAKSKRGVVTITADDKVTDAGMKALRMYKAFDKALDDPKVTDAEEKLNDSYLNNKDESLQKQAIKNYQKVFEEAIYEKWQDVGNDGKSHRAMNKAFPGYDFSDIDIIGRNAAKQLAKDQAVALAKDLEEASQPRHSIRGQFWGPRNSYPYEGYENVEKLLLSEIDYNEYQDWFDKNIG